MNRWCFTYALVALLCATEGYYQRGYRPHHNHFLDSMLDSMDSQDDYWKEFENQMRSLFFFKRFQFGSVNVTEDAYITTLPLQGFSKEDVTVKITQNLLSVVAQHSTRYYSYTYLMPEDAQLNETTARHYEDGYLVITTPRLKKAVDTTEVITSVDNEDDERYVTPEARRRFTTMKPAEVPEEEEDEEEEGPRPSYGFRPINPDAEILEEPELNRVRSVKYRRPELVGFTTTAPDLKESQDANELENEVLVNVIAV